MIRLSMILLWLILFGAAAGRYKAETAVREIEAEIARLEAARDAETREIKVLRAEIAYLEGPDRLAEMAREHTDLRPLSGAQLMTADDFLMAFGVGRTAGDDHAGAGARPASPSGPGGRTIAVARADEMR